MKPQICRYSNSIMKIILEVMCGEDGMFVVNLVVLHDTIANQYKYHDYFRPVILGYTLKVVTF